MSPELACPRNSAELHGISPVFPEMVDKNKNIKRAVCLGILMFAAFALSGCFNYEQDTILKSDMSGTIKVHLFPNQEDFDSFGRSLHFPGQEAKQESRENRESAGSFAGFNINESEYFKAFNLENISNKRVEYIDKEDGTHVYIKIDFKNIATLYKNDKKIKVLRKNNLIVFEEDVNLVCFGNEFRVSYNEVLKGGYTRYTLHMPGKILEANTNMINDNKAAWHFEGKESCKQKIFRIKAVGKDRHEFLRWIDNVVEKVKIYFSSEK